MPSLGLGYSPLLSRPTAIQTIYGVPGAVLHLRSDSGVVQAANKVSQWSDQTANGNNVTQSTAALKPTYATGGTNGLPKLTLAAASLQRMVGGAFSTQNAALFIVANFTDSLDRAAAATTNVSFGVNTGLALVFNNASQGVLGRQETSGGNRDVNVTNSNTPYVGVTSIFELESAAGTLTEYVNGTLIGSTTDANTNDTAVALVVGALDNAGTFAMNGDLYEILLYNRTLTAFERTMVKSVLGSKYNITVS